MKVVKPLNIIVRGTDLLNEQDFNTRLLPVGQYEADRIVTIFNRMMDHLKAERLKLQEQNYFLDLLINASPLGIIILGPDGKIAQLNPAAKTMLGKTDGDITGKKPEELHVKLADELATIPVNQTRTIWLSDFSVYKCTHATFADKGFRHPFFLMEVLTDEVRNVEKRAYEKVIRMIAHEVNNSIAGVTATLDTVNSTLQNAMGNEDLCEVMGVCIERCLSMNRFIGRFAEVVKIPDPDFIYININELGLSCVRLMESDCNERNIQIRTEFEKEMPKIFADPVLIEQVVLNIIKNSIESIGKNGEILIRTFSSGILEIRDNGPGITPEKELKLFTPFFSTKADGQGIGLILIREILDRHCVKFSLRTDEDGFTRFLIHFNIKEFTL